jgi:hypothetical protein
VDVQGASPSEHAPLIQWGCTGNENQKFVFHHVVSPTSVFPEYLLEAGHSGMYIHVTGGDLTAPLDQWFCTGADNQLFTMTPTDTGFWQIQVKGTNQGKKQCMSTNGSTNSGSSIVIEECVKGNKSQEFSLPGL